MSENISSPTYFPEFVYVYHMASFPSNFSFVVSLDDLPSNIVFVGRFELKSIQQITRTIHIQDLSKEK